MKKTPEKKLIDNKKSKTNFLSNVDLKNEIINLKAELQELRNEYHSFKKANLKFSKVTHLTIKSLCKAVLRIEKQIQDMQGNKTDNKKDPEDPIIN